MFEVSQTEGRDGSEAEGECNYKETWSSIIESSVIMHFDRAMVHFTTRMQCKLPPRIIQSPNRITHPLPYNSVRAHSATVVTQVQGLVYLLPAHASRTRSTRCGRTSSPASSLLGMNHRSTVSNSEEPPHRNLFVTRRGSYGVPCNGSHEFSR